MPTKLATTVRNIKTLVNEENSELIEKFHQFMISHGSSERHQNNNLKAIIYFANFLGPNIAFSSINTSKIILSFLDSKIKSKQDDSDQKWITTWNDYMHRIKHFLRWMHNGCSDNGNLVMDDWITPTFLQIINNLESLSKDLWFFDNEPIQYDVQNSENIKLMRKNRGEANTHDIIYYNNPLERMKGLLNQNVSS